MPNTIHNQEASFKPVASR